MYISFFFNILTKNEYNVIILKYHRNVKLELKYLLKYLENVLVEIFEYNNYLIMQDYYYRIFKIDIIYHKKIILMT